MRTTDLVLILVGELLTTAVHAQLPGKATDAEIARLPPYCAVRLKGNTSPEYKQWERTLGPGFLHTHHYCTGLVQLNRYRDHTRRSPQDRAFICRGCRGNELHGHRASRATYILLPEIYLNRGIAFSLQKRDALAVTDMNKALKLNPHLVGAYLALAMRYAEMKQDDRALEIVTIGLKYNPDVRSLQGRYRELGGKLPYPEPIESKEVKPQPPDDPVAIAPKVRANATAGQPKPDPQHPGRTHPRTKTRFTQEAQLPLLPRIDLKGPRRNHSAKFKATVELTVIRREKSLDQTPTCRAIAARSIDSHRGLVH